jgi:tetratricopeptide (TPR) repeat protein
MIPAYLDLIQAEGVLPLSRLSGAFLNPPSALHLQYAYYQSSLVVEFLIEDRGLDAMRDLLSDLAEGRPIDITLEKRMGSPEKLDRAMDAFVLERAAELEARADWEPPDLPEAADADALAAWLEAHPDSFRGLERLAARLLEERQWAEARRPLEKLLELCPDCTQPGSAYELLARVHRELGDAEAEKRTLEKLSELDADAVAPRLRLLELCREDRDWRGLGRTAERLLAVNPLLESPHRALVRAHEELGSPAQALSSYRALLELEPMDPADLHYRLGRLLRREGKLEEAKRQLLQSLEEAPRFREAHRELLAVVRGLKREVEPPTPDALEKPGGSHKAEDES